MRDALNKTGRPIWFALCGWQPFYAWQAPGAVLGNSWRVGMDTGQGWGPVMSNVNGMLRGGPNGTSLASYGRPGGWNDMSLLLNPGMGSGANFMTLDRHRSQFGFHCIFNANMLLTGNLSSLDPFVLETWGNAEAVEINQDTAHTFIQLPLEAAAGAATAGSELAPARVAECGGEPDAQNWTFNAPAQGYLTNSANKVCLNVDSCKTAVIYDGCTTTGPTCNPAGKFYNEQWALDARGALLSALPGAAQCATVGADGTVALAVCADPLTPSQVWRYTAGTGELALVADGRCLTVTAPQPPGFESLLIGRELEDGSWGLFGVNNENSTAPLVCGAACLSAMGFQQGDELNIRDVWAHKDLPQVTAAELQLPAPGNGGSVFWRVRK